MIFFRKNLPYLAAICLAGLLKLSLIYYLNWKIWLIAVIALIFIVNFLLIPVFQNKKASLADFFGFLIPLFWLGLSAFTFMYFQEKIWLQNIIMIITAFLYAIFLRNIYLYYHQTDKYIPYALENSGNYLNVFLNFIFFTALFSYVILGVISFYWGLAFLIVFIFSITWQNFWLYKLDQKRFLFALIFALIFTEIYATLKFWPTSFFVNGLMLAIVYFLLVNLTKLHFANNLNKKNSWKYIISSATILIIILSTAQWS